MRSVKESWKHSPYWSVKLTSYFDVYQTLLAKFIGEDIIFVEVGVLNGGSLFMWRDFLGKKARIIGVDLNPEAKRWRDHGFEIFIGNQSDKKFWHEFYSKVGTIDVLVDDGGHRYHQQLITLLETLPHLKDGGIVMVEDVGTSYMKEFGGPSPVSFVNMAKKLVDHINAQPFLRKKHHLGLHSIQFFEHLIAFHVNRNFVSASERCENSGEKVDAKDFRYSDNEQLDAESLAKFLRLDNFNA